MEKVVGRKPSGKTCTHSGGCSRPLYARGYCNAHWIRLNKYGDPGPAGIAERVPAKVRGAKCEIPKCPNPRSRGKFCTSHAHKQWRYGNPLEPDRRSKPEAKCVVRICTRMAAWGRSGHCSGHLAQIAKYGRVVRPKLRDLAKRGSGSVTPDGYRTVVRKGHPNAYGANGSILEHRLVASEFLDRPLRKNEHVHHRNNVKADNSIGPCFMSNRCECDEFHNLELWAKVQPAGARIEDLVRYARTILKRYGDESERVSTSCPSSGRKSKGSGTRLA